MDGKIYERYTDLFNKENELIKNRINWLFATQTILFGGLEIPQIDSKLKFTIKVIGLSSSIFFLISISAAIITYCRFQFTNVPIDQNKRWEYPEFQRWKPVIISGFLAAIALPIVFIWAWYHQF